MTVIYILGSVFLMIALGILSAFLFLFSSQQRWIALLKQYPCSSAKSKGNVGELHFEYADSQDVNLQKLRTTYNLDDVAGSGPEIERLINLMKWVNRLTWHIPSPMSSGPYNALHMIELLNKRKRGINCWMYAFILNEAYLSMSFSSRLVHLEPFVNPQKESHYVVSVYSHQLNKWLFMDPDFGGYFTDENGTVLSIPEIRCRLIAGQPLLPNREVKGFTVLLGKRSYAWYLSKNIFRYTCSLRSEFDQETPKSKKVFCQWIPFGFNEHLLVESLITASGNSIISTNDEELFWQKP